jgi:hypothetical protein
MVDLRNELVHFKGNKRFDPNATPEDFHKDLIERFRSKKLLAEDIDSWVMATCNRD